MKPLHVNQIIWLLGTGVALLVACTRVSGGVGGQLIDADTKQPIQGATIRLERTAHCMGLVHGHSHHLSPKEARTDEAGRFSVGAGLTIVPGCIAVDWTDRLSILAPGYFGEFLTHHRMWFVSRPWVTKDFDILRSGPIELDRMRYAVELEEYRRRAKTWLTEEAGPIWQEAVATINSARPKPLSEPGVFATQPGVALDQIVAMDFLPFDRRPRRRTLILARDKRTGSVFGWTTKGTQFSLPLPTGTGWSLVGASRRLGYPFLEYNNRIYHPEILDFPATVKRLSAKNWSSTAFQVGGVKAAAPYSRLLITVEQNGQAIGFYKLEERTEGKNRLRIAVSLGPGRSVSELLPGGRPPMECLTGGARK